ncbi:MAG: hypothetical protein QXV22_02595 [Thermoplasmataceae archaeon]
MAGSDVRVFQRFKREGRVPLWQINRELIRVGKQHPDYDLFFDGDLFAICGRKRA